MKLFRGDEELNIIREQASQHDHLAVSVLAKKGGAEFREALHVWRMANWKIFRSMVVSWRSGKLIERYQRGPAAYGAV